MFKPIVPALTLGLALTFAANIAQAAPAHKQMAHKTVHKKTHKKTAHKKIPAASVYVIEGDTETFTPEDAKKMGYEGPMGEKMIKMKKAPGGYKPATADNM